MIKDFEFYLDKYAEVIVKVGLNIQPGQQLLIGSPRFGIDGTPLEAAPLVRRVVKHAYLAGATYVDVMWGDPELQLIRLEHADPETLSMFPKWRIDYALENGSNGNAYLVVYAVDPDQFDGKDEHKISVLQKSAVEHGKPMFDLFSQQAMNASIVSTPVLGWTRKLFADDSLEDGTVKFWDAIFEICRAKTDDPVAAWKSHIEDLRKRKTYLNEKKYSTLQYKAPGTDLRVGLPSGHIWHGGSITSQSGIPFVPNMPTEEVFTMPHRDQIDGVVKATKPLNIGGMMIDDFSMRFENGRAVNVSAQKGESALKKVMNTDEGASGLGEVALVPHSSPISQSRMVFYNILYDENASCHLALGNAYKFTAEGGSDLSDEEFAAMGGNQSLIHIDFMIGSGEMDIDGITGTGDTEPIMRNGEWTFEV